MCNVSLVARVAPAHENKYGSDTPAIGKSTMASCQATGSGSLRSAGLLGIRTIDGRSMQAGSAHMKQWTFQEQRQPKNDWASQEELMIRHVT